LKESKLTKHKKSTHLLFKFHSFKIPRKVRLKKQSKSNSKNLSILPASKTQPIFNKITMSQRCCLSVSVVPFDKNKSSKKKVFIFNYKKFQLP